MSEPTLDKRRIANRHPVPFESRRRRGSVYVIVLAVAANVLVIGLAAIHLARLRLRQVRRAGETREARLLAQSAVEQAVSVMNNYAGNWREDFDNNQETSPMAFGAGQMSFVLVDEDGSVADDATDPLWIHGIGRVGDAVWVERAKARVDQGLPLEFLRTAIHSSGQISIPTGKSLTVSGAPASTDGELIADGPVDGDAEAVVRSGIGSISGSVTVPAEKKGMPINTLFEEYAARATTLPYIGHLETMVLSPGVNQYDGSGTNPDGAYYIDTGGSDLQIFQMRLHGTLIVDVGAGELYINTCLMEPYREDFPVLIVRGNVCANIFGVSMSESPPNSHNFNPSGAPYRGEADSDTSDSYSSGIHGLVHVIGNLELTSVKDSRGVYVVDGQVAINGDPQLVHDPELMLNPPLGYTDDPNSTAMIIRSGSWSRQPAP